MAFPSPSLSPPALNTWQMSYQGLTFGGITHGNAYQLQSLAVDMPDIGSGDVQRALDQGEFIGLDVLPGADITIVQGVITDGTSLDHALQQLGGVMAPGGITEQPLWLQTPAGTFCRLCRPRKHNAPIDVNRVFAGGVIATSLLHSTDPRWYAAPSQSQTVGLPAPVGGLTFPVTFNASFGGGGVGGILSVVNSGLFEMRPVLVVTGPCTNPVISNLSIAGAPWVGVSISLNTGDTLTIDLDWQSVLYTTAGSTSGQSRRNAVIQGSTWWNCPPGANTIEFTTSDGTQVAGTLTVQSASAYLSI